MTWLALRVAVPSGVGEAVADFLSDAGAPAVTREVGDAGERVVVEAHVPAADHARLADALDRYLATLDAGGTPETGPVPVLDWEAVFRRHHRPIVIGERLLVAPPWDVPVASGREVLVVEPGRAFGTGQHATTRGCLEEIEAAVATAAVRRALDVGTGSGVLAAALSRLGVPDVVALDADPDAIGVARGNLARNGAAGVRVFAGTAAACRGRFDLVVANLLAGTLVAEAAVLDARTAPSGRLVVSGILAHQVDDVIAAFPGWRAAATRAEQEWRTLRLVRDAAC